METCRGNLRESIKVGDPKRPSFKGVHGHMHSYFPESIKIRDPKSPAFGASDGDMHRYFAAVHKSRAPHKAVI